MLDSMTSTPVSQPLCTLDLPNVDREEVLTWLEDNIATMPVIEITPTLRLHFKHPEDLMLTRMRWQ